MAMSANVQPAPSLRRPAWRARIKKNLFLYLMFLPVALYYLVFKYAPMFGLVIAFKDYNAFVGILGSKWVGMKYFDQFVHSMYFWRLIRNTLAISFLDLLVNFPAPIILALMLNEVQHKQFKSVVQTISYLPHFVSTVVIVGILVNFLSLSTGLINNILAAVGLQRVHFLAEPRYFWPIFTLMNVWRSVGWSSIIYIAALSGIDPTLYEAAVVDGAGRWRQLFCVTLPALLPTIVTLLIMRVGHVLDVGYEAIILMYNPQIYETADVISTYVYRRGLIDADYSFAAAVGLFQSLVGMLMVMGANALSRKLTETRLW
jgi:putative aldouronate transport system permease protein